MTDPCLSRTKLALASSVLFVALATAACTEDTENLGTADSELSSGNGLSTNGLSTNGLSTNGLSTNGLSTNGLSTNGFAAWFSGQSGGTAYTDMVMKYVVRCALPAGSTVTYTYQGTTYSWDGGLGLAPVWASGNPIPVAEQQLISACLAVHANKYNVQMGISVRGYQANGREIPVTNSEDNNYPYNEGCFFGNLFDGTGVFSAYSLYSPLVNKNKSSQRACAMSNGKVGTCAPMVATGYSCESLCWGNFLAVSNDFEYQSCAWNGTVYRPLSTRLTGAEIATCGDGVCAASESAATCPTDCR